MVLVANYMMSFVESFVFSLLNKLHQSSFSRMTLFLHFNSNYRTIYTCGDFILAFSIRHGNNPVRLLDKNLLAGLTD